jgi:hypothetical protein
MEIVEVSIEFPSGMVITDHATYFPDIGQIQPSERLLFLLRHLGESEAPPTVTVLLAGTAVRADLRIDGNFEVDANEMKSAVQPPTFSQRLFGHDWTKDQRQQFGRLCHSFTVVSLVGAAGILHSVKTWTASELLSEAALIFAVVVTFLLGMNSMNGD